MKITVFRTFFCAWIAALAVLVVAGCATMPDVARTVVVIDTEGRPIQGARVYVRNAGPVTRGMTGSGGHVRIRTPAQGVSLVVERQGYMPAQVISTNMVIKIMMQAD